MSAKVVAFSLLSMSLGCSSSSSPGAAPSDAGPTTETGPALPTDTVAATTRASCGYDVGSLAAATQGASAPDGAAIPIDTIVIVMMENRSFDHYFQDLANQPGWSAGDGGATASNTSVDVAPPGASNPGIDDAGAQPQTHGTQLCFADTNHGWDGTHQEIHDGKMDGFFIANDGTHEDPTFGPPDFLSGARAMTYYTKADLPFMHWAAENFAIGDRYFASVPGPTWPNREYLYAGTSWGETTTGAFPVPTTPTVLDSLNTKGVSWGNYAGSLSTVFLFTESKTYQSGYAKKEYPFTQFATDAAAGKLPAVTFLDPNLYPEGYDNDDEHPPAVMQVGQNWLAGVVKTLFASPQWPHMALFLLYDEHGGLYDHVAPPSACPPDATQPKITADAGSSTYGGFNEYGVRLPFAVFSPYAKHHYVSHQVFDHTSVLRFVEARFGLPALTKRDANALAPWDVFDFKAAPMLTPPAVPDVPVDPTIISQCGTLFNASIPTTYSQ
jgi:phospholipase C